MIKTVLIMWLEIPGEESVTSNDMQKAGQNCKPESGTTGDKQNQSPWPLVRERTIPTERLSLVDDI
jgi:hypothetical protein